MKPYTKIDGCTFTNTCNCGECLHENGWYITVKFWVFKNIYLFAVIAANQ